MSDFDQGGIFFSDQSANNGVGSGSQPAGAEYLPNAAGLKYREFIRYFRVEDAYTYRTLLDTALGQRTYLLDVDIDHLIAFDARLATDLLHRPAVHMPLFEKVRRPSCARGPCFRTLFLSRFTSPAPV